MDYLTLLLGVIIGAALTTLYARAQGSALRERLGQREAELQTTRAAQAELVTRGETLQRERAAALQTAAAHEAEAAAQARRAEQYLHDIKEIKTALQAEFEATAAKLLEEKSARFTDLNKTQVEGLLQPLRQQLTDFRQRVDAVYKTESDDRSALKAQIEQLRLLNTRITDEAHALTRALKGQSQARGAWGELVLERLLESSGLRGGEDYVVQESITGGDGRRLRPDVILRLPDERHLVIDSKVSLVAYEQAVNAPDDDTRDSARKLHVAAVRRHVEELSGKRYEDAGQLRTPDFVLMFIPIEPAFSLALETDVALYEWAFERRVILVTTPTLLATLKTVASLWKQDRQARNVQEIARRGGLLYDKFVGLYDDLEAVGRHLDRTRESYDGVLSKLKSGRGNLLTQVEDLKTLGAKAAKSLPPTSSDET